MLVRQYCSWDSYVYSDRVGFPFGIVDIKELKLLGDFDHPNIVRFVSAMSVSGVLEASLIAEFPVARC